MKLFQKIHFLTLMLLTTNITFSPEGKSERISEQTRKSQENETQKKEAEAQEAKAEDKTNLWTKLKSKVSDLHEKYIKPHLDKFRTKTTANEASKFEIKKPTTETQIADKTKEANARSQEVATKETKAKSVELSFGSDATVKPQEPSSNKPSDLSKKDIEKIKELLSQSKITVNQSISEQLSNLGIKNLNDLSQESLSDIFSKSIADLGASISFLPPENIKYLKIDDLKPFQIKYLEPEHIKELNLNQIKDLSPEQVNYLMPNQIKDFSKTQLTTLINSQPTALADRLKSLNYTSSKIPTLQEFIEKNITNTPSKTPTSTTTNSAEKLTPEAEAKLKTTFEKLSDDELKAEVKKTDNKKVQTLIKDILRKRYIESHMPK